MTAVRYPGQEGGRLEAPAWCDPPEHRPPATGFAPRPVWPSKMFTIKLELEEFRRFRPDLPVYDASQGDGGMSLGGIPRDELAEALRRYLPADRSTAYGDPVGRADVRRAIFERYHRLDGRPGLSPDCVVQGDGGRDLIQKWVQLVVATTGGAGGALVVGPAPWGSYTQGPYVGGLAILRAPGSADDGFRLTPEAIDAAVDAARADGRPVVGLVLTSPDNPTGNTTPPDRLAALAAHALERGVRYVLVDLIYQAVVDKGVGTCDIGAFLEAIPPEARGRVAFLDGLTKSAGASNVRSAHLVLGSEDLAARFKGIATHTVLPGALGEAAALEVYGSDEPLRHPWVRRVVEPTAASRRIVRERLSERGLRFICDQGYYAFVNVWPWLGRRIPSELRPLDPATDEPVERVRDVATLKTYLATRWGVAIIHGSVFHQPDFVRFSYANRPDYTAAALDRFLAALDALED